MPEIDPLEQQEWARNEQSGRHFVAVLCFLLAFLCLLIFLTQPLGASGLAVLLLVLLFGMSGVMLLERGKARSTDVPLPAQRDTRTSTAIIVEGTVVQPPSSVEYPPTPALEEEAEERTSQDGPQAGDRGLPDEELEEQDEGVEAFKALVEQALTALPAEFQEHLHNVAVLVESEPDEQTKRSMEVGPGHLLLGCYQGVPLTAQGHSGAPLPGRIILYQKSLEAYCHGDPERMREQVQRAVLHEVAHYFGLDHEQMPHWVR
jgi:predicted Zn-dependent protease with MMP-like domain